MAKSPRNYSFGEFNMVQLSASLEEVKMASKSGIHLTNAEVSNFARDRLDAIELLDTKQAHLERCEDCREQIEKFRNLLKRVVRKN